MLDRGPEGQSPVACCLAVTFHAIVQDNLNARLPSLNVDLRYTLPLSQFRNLTSVISPASCLTVAEFAQQSTGKWQILTFDDGDATAYETAFPTLLAAGLKGTFFITSRNVGQSGYVNYFRLREMADAGMEIASHGLTHRYLVSLSRREAAAEIRDSKAEIEDALGRAVTSFAPVGGHFSRWMLNAAAESGYRVFSTMIPGWTSLRTGLLIMRRNHLQFHHGARYVARVLAGDSRTLLANRLRYELLRFPKITLGMRNYDRLKTLLLRHASNAAGRQDL